MKKADAFMNIPRKNRMTSMMTVTANGPIDLMAGTPVEADEIEHLMASRHN